MNHIYKTFTVFLIFTILPNSLDACSTCFGDPSAPASEGLNWAIITLLGVTGSVLGGVIHSIVGIAKKTKQFNRSDKNLGETL